MSESAGIEQSCRIGVDMGGTKIEAAILDPEGKVLLRERLPTPRNDYPGTLGAIRDLVQGIESRTGRKATGIGVAIPGAISAKTGLIKNANSTWLIGKAFDEDLEAALERPVRLANDANCFALSEAMDGAGENADVVFGVIIGTGVGGGIVVNKQVLAGRNHICGEWGHAPLPWPTADELPGHSCYCGKRGCVETFLSGPGFARDYHSGLENQGGKALDAPQIIELAMQGDQAAMAALDRYIDRMARSLTMIINILDPDVIVLGGGMSNVTELYERIPERWNDYVFSDEISTILKQNHHGDSSGVRGAAWLFP